MRGAHDLVVLPAAAVGFLPFAILIHDRAMTIAMNEPRGPVYLSLPREPLAEALGGDWSMGRPLPGYRVAVLDDDGA